MPDVTLNELFEIEVQCKWSEQFCLEGFPKLTCETRQLQMSPAPPLHTAIPKLLLLCSPKASFYTHRGFALCKCKIACVGGYITLPLHVDPCAALTTPCPCELVLRGTLEVVLGAKRHKQGRNTWGGDGEAQVVSIS